MTQRERAFRSYGIWFVSAVGAFALSGGGCHAGAAKFPWGDAAPSAPRDHTAVRTLNEGYSRTRSQVWVREVSRPTRAALDYAAYHANFMIADPEPETPLSATAAPDTSHPFEGQLDAQSLTGDVAVFDKETSFAPAGPRQHLFGAIRFLEGRYSSFQLIAGGAAPAPALLAEMDAIVRSFVPIP